jgi:gluconate 2-dehydrogenase gamma chain
MSVSRRDVLKSLTLGAVAGSVLRVIPAEAAEIAHHMIAAEKASTAGYKPKYFPEHQYKTLEALCDAIIPKDERSGGALQAGAPELIDLLTSENADYQLQFGGGILWLDSTCNGRFGKAYLECAPEQQKQILDLISYRRNALTDASLSQGVEFFRFLRNLTTDAYVTSEIGIKDLGYVGNTFVLDFPGCPPVPGT